MKMNEFKVKTKVYEIVLGEMGGFIKLEEITKPISTKYLNIGGENGVGGYTITMYYIKEHEYPDGEIVWRMLYKDQLFFSYEVK